MDILILILVAYLIGSIPFGYILVKNKTGKDIRTVGSGNNGATNAFRSAGKKTAIIVGILDFLKGAIPAIYILVFWQNWGMVLILLALVVGHVWPIYIGFKGGKGVATGLGIALTLLVYSVFVNQKPLSFVIFAVLALLGPGIFAYYKKRVVSAASILSVSMLIFLFYFLTYSEVFAVSIFLISLLVIFAHRENIKRLIAGTERKTEFFA